MVSTPGNGAAPDKSIQNKASKEHSGEEQKHTGQICNKKKEKKKVYISFTLLWNSQEMSGTACSDMWDLWSSSDRLSDSVSPCSLETTRKTYTHLYTRPENYSCTAWREATQQIKMRQAGFHHSEVMRHRGNIYQVHNLPSKIWDDESWNIGVSLEILLHVTPEYWVYRHSEGVIMIKMIHWGHRYQKEKKFLIYLFVKVVSDHQKNIYYQIKWHKKCKTWLKVHIEKVSGWEAKNL